MEKSALASSATTGGPWIGWAATAVGLAAVVAALVASTTGAGQGFTFGFGAFIVFLGLLSVAVRDRNAEYWGLVVVGLAMFIVPFLGNGYAADPGASWTCWVAGAVAMILGGVGWVSGKAPTGSDVADVGGGPAKRGAGSFWIGRVVLVVAL